MAENAETSLDTQVCASLPRDAQLICASLTAVGITCRRSTSAVAIAADIPSRADIIVLFEEVLDERAVGVLVDAFTASRTMVGFTYNRDRWRRSRKPEESKTGDDE